MITDWFISFVGLLVIKNKPKKEWRFDPEPIVMEETTWLTSTDIKLDKYNCHLNAVVSTSEQCVLVLCHQKPKKKVHIKFTTPLMVALIDQLPDQTDSRLS